MKALFRRGSAFIGLKQYEQARADLTKASSLDNHDAAITAALETANTAIRAEHAQVRH